MTALISLLPSVAGINLTKANPISPDPQGTILIEIKSLIRQADISSVHSANLFIGNPTLVEAPIDTSAMSMRSLVLLLTLV